jgi:hypothetical protein
MRESSPDDKLQRLETIYRWYDEIASALGEWACLPGCSTCCTSLVIMTSLESSYMWKKFPALLKDRLLTWPGDIRLPALTMTTNERASACIAREDFEEEDISSTPSPSCPLLEDGRCTYYEARPLMCHLMLSTVLCEKTGRAEMPSALLSLTTVCLQLIEDLDQTGWSGYLLHLLPRFGGDDLADAYRNNAVKIDDDRVLRNHPNPGLLVPPEHQPQIQQWLRDLHSRF